MKANEAPEKLYIGIVPSELGGNKFITCNKDFPNAVEYTRTDAFIEKACAWLKCHLSSQYDDLEEFARAFKKAMEK